jgi:hypothetical protein
MNVLVQIAKKNGITKKNILVLQPGLHVSYRTRYAFQFSRNAQGLTNAYQEGIITELARQSFLHVALRAGPSILPTCGAGGDSSHGGLREKLPGTELMVFTRMYRLKG